MMEVDRNYCIGKDGAKVFLHGVPAIQVYTVFIRHFPYAFAATHFKTIGTFVAMSVIQGNLDFPFSENIFTLILLILSYLLFGH